MTRLQQKAQGLAPGEPGDELVPIANPDGGAGRAPLEVQIGMGSDAGTHITPVVGVVVRSSAGAPMVLSWPLGHTAFVSFLRSARLMQLVGSS